MDEKSNENFGNICTILGGALLGMAIVDQATKTVMPEMQKLTSGETFQDLKMLPASKENDDVQENKSKRDEDQKKHDEERKTFDDKIAMLEQELAKYKSKSDEHEGEN